MRVALAAMCLLAACLRETLPPPDGGFASDDGGGGTSDAPEPIDASVDAGLANHDEDGDGVDDAIDNCPQSHNPQQRNLGEMNAGNTPDGVGDICDPDPAESGNEILFFDGMHAGVVPGRWNLASMATASGDTIRLDSNGVLVTAQQFPANVMVNVAASLASTQQPSNAVTIAGNWQSVAAFVGCRREIATTRLLYGANPSGGAPPFTAGQEIWMELLTSATVIDCGTSIEGGVWVPLQTATTGTLSPGRAMVMATGAPANVQFMIVVSRP